ncbi:ATP-dependent helicase [Actinospica durhamensis]|uniref:ATP-dependent helicase n=1 Tax=Actinospica durhamensis TaxID=1508375 RepID=A0A941IR15_9ACTN|nr:ATP-dependent helicase [Actinospica durhamensis]MBR7836879.1 ATP-dependent helicase [Actinospica durhamensis]
MDYFAEPTRRWLSGAFAQPTAAQLGAWEEIKAGHNALVVAPTGSGKTLAAFLAALDRLAFGPAAEDPKLRCRVLYVSPLKALGVDVERNLRAPLAGLRQEAVRAGLPEPEVRVAVRTGDTPADERRRFSTKPPDILITTPESLFLLLTSQAREALAGIETVIVDEVHAIAGTKRGAHLALSLERLDLLLSRPAQRIGLSATVRPPEEIAAWLGGPRPAVVVAPPSAKTFDLRVVVPVEDMAELASLEDETVPADQRGRRQASIWPHVEQRVADLIEQHTSTLVFANSRRLAERLCNRLNEIYFEQLSAAEADRPSADESGSSGAPAITAADGSDGAAAAFARTPIRTPAELMGQAGQAGGAPPLLARAHHGSVSKEQRAEVEEALKAGRLPAVVATSSLELGIDMGAVDLVVQVESPPSVASGLQRVGRAGHQVGAVSRGVIFPKFRGDLLQSAVVAERMRAGLIEAVHAVRNPLDVLAQQLVAMVAIEPWQTTDLLAAVRRAAPFTTLAEPVFEAVLDMLAGRYPSDEFAELRPRLVWDRETGQLQARPGAQRLAVTSGGTIPDRGLYGVFLVGDQKQARRVGELDEEMVYESRVGDVFTLGTSSWRIEEITHDRVLVSPAPGQPGRLPFWHGDALGRPLELGRALGAFTRELGALEPEQARERLREAGLDAWAAGNLLAYLTEQREATGQVPDDRTIVVERFHDELGDWRMVIHSPFGAQVHAPWALAIGAKLRALHGMDAQVMHADDGIVLRIPDADWDEDSATARPEAALARFAAEEIEQLVTDEVGGSALFAARFRECAGRALLLPRRRPNARVPLWQQRQRAAHLLAVASKYASFPIVLETVRECLQDVFDLPGLVELLGDIEGRRVRIVEVETPAPSPFAKSLLFGYIAQFLYEGDSPLAERRAAALAVDPSLLAELLGQPELRDLFDNEIIDQLEAELQHLAEDRRARDAEDAADLLRLLGPLSTEEAARRGIAQSWLAELERSRRVIRVRIAGEERWAAIEDAGRLRDALGAPLPVGVPEAFTEPVADPLGDLLARYARTHAPFPIAQAAAVFGLGVAVVLATLERLAAQQRVVRGGFRPDTTGEQWCDARVLRRLRRRTVAALREQAEPVAPSALARLLPAWQGATTGARLRGVDGVLRAVEQLAGYPVPASALERLILPARVTDYQPAMLDELTSGGEVAWTGAGALAVDDGWVTLAPAAIAPAVLPEPLPIDGFGPLHRAILEELAHENALFFRGLMTRLGQSGTEADPASVLDALWDLLWAGHLTNDTLAPMRALLGAGKTAHRAKRPTPRGRYASLRLSAPLPSAEQALTTVGAARSVGRWSRTRRIGPLGGEVGAGPAGAALTPAQVAQVAQLQAEVLLDRYGLVTRGSVASERGGRGALGNFSAAYRVLSAFEEVGRVRRGYFVDGLGAAQFAADGVVDRLRTEPKRVTGFDEGRDPDPFEASGAQPLPEPYPWTNGAGAYPPSGPDGSRGRKVKDAPDTLVLAATDPANAYGAAVDWPQRAETEPGRAGHRPGRKAGSLVVLHEGDLVWYVERGGRTVLTFQQNRELLELGAAALAESVKAGRVGALTIAAVDGVPVLSESGVGSGGQAAPGPAALLKAGFTLTPQGLRLRG